jgi:hypothetical protein
MKRIFATIFVFALMLSTTAFSQGWTFQGYFPDSTNAKGNTGAHGVAVSPDGAVWMQFYGATDSILQADGTYGNTRAVYSYKADGTQDFPPIKTVTVDGETDTLWNSFRGMRADNNGNILFASYNTLYRLDYKTGEGMNKLVYIGGTLTAPAVDAAGDVFVGPVIPGNPIQVFGSDFSALGNAIDTSVGYSRTFDVSADGNTIYWAGYTNNAIFEFQRTDEFSPYVLVDTVMKGLACESIGWNHKTGLLWASSGSAAGGLPNNYVGATTNYSPYAWYAFDTQTWEVKDSIKWHFYQEGDDARPRGIDFSPDGNTAYVCAFGASTYPAFEKFTRPSTDVQQQSNGVVTDYKLSQNYPNPFNPTTEISYSVAKSGFVSLKVYDMLGREVATLVNSEKATGNYTVNFNATNLASGTYVYQLQVNGVMLTKKMSLLK